MPRIKAGRCLVSRPNFSKLWQTENVLKEIMVDDEVFAGHDLRALQRLLAMSQAEIGGGWVRRGAPLVSLRWATWLTRTVRWQI